jgi:hypothetical protein
MARILIPLLLGCLLISKLNIQSQSISIPEGNLPEETIYYGKVSSEACQLQLQKTLASMNYADDLSYKLDSAIRYDYDETSGQWMLSHMTIYNYDAAQRTLSGVGNKWDETEQSWAWQSKVEYEYDGQNQPTLKTWSQWNMSSASWYIQGKQEWTYDQNGDLLEYIYSSPHWFTSEFMGTRKEHYEYDALRQIILHELYEMDYNSQQWTLQSKENYAYNSREQLIEKIFYNHFQPGDPNEPDLRVTYTYGTNNLVNVSTSYDRDAVNGQWMYQNSSTFTYNANNDVVIHHGQSWNVTNQQWKDNYKYEFSYDLANLVIQRSRFDFKYNSGWVEEEIWCFQYDSNGNQVLYVDSLLHSTDSIFFVKRKNNYSYNSDNLLLTREQYVSDDTDPYLLMVYDKIENSYDPSGNLYLMTEYEADDTTNSFIPSMRFDISHELAVGIDEVVFPIENYDWLIENSKQMPVYSTTSYWNIQTAQWDLWEKTKNCISGLYSIEETEIIDFTIFPNPAHETVSVRIPITNGSVLEICDIRGRILISQHLSSLNTISVKHLEAGIYIVRLRKFPKQAQILIVE